MKISKQISEKILLRKKLMKTRNLNNEQIIKNEQIHKITEKIIEKIENKFTKNTEVKISGFFPIKNEINCLEILKNMKKINKSYKKIIEKIC